MNKLIPLVALLMVGCNQTPPEPETRMWHREDNPECLEHYSARFGVKYAETVCVEFWED